MRGASLMVVSTNHIEESSMNKFKVDRHHKKLDTEWLTKTVTERIRK